MKVDLSREEIDIILSAFCIIDHVPIKEERKIIKKLRMIKATGISREEMEKYKQHAREIALGISQGDRK